jgi:ferredoxin/coenzyme F420-reducing hydrogenase delta subunit
LKPSTFSSLKDRLPRRRRENREAFVTAVGEAEHEAGHGQPGSTPSRPTEPAVRGAGFLKRVDSAFMRIDDAVARVLPDDLNPLARTGAVATTTLIIACVTGILLLLWYKASLYQAYDSVVAMSEAPLTAGFIRTLHRYSSDACLFFTMLHGIKLFFAGRFAGARWLSWVTGIVLVVMLWFEGWIGYWLVWDLPGGQVALGTAKLLDPLPIFADPPGRSFLTNEGLNSLFFFVVFFVHVFLPLFAAGITWLHIARISRPKLLTGKKLTWWVTGTLSVMSLVLPAGLTGPADMTAMGGEYDMDWWYLAPLALTDRLSAGALWSILLVGCILVTAVPWLFGRRKPIAATVVESLCNACTKCYQDCPYEAITLAPRTDGRAFDARAFVLEDKCVGCGICAGSCDTAGIGLPQLRVQAERRRLEALIDAEVAGGGSPWVAFTCGNSAAAELQPNAETGACVNLPGWIGFELPCSGWTQPLTVERALKHGAAGVAIVSCRPGSCTQREGADWTALRMEGKREPSLRSDKIDASRVHVIALDRPEAGELRTRLAALQAGRPTAPASAKGIGRILAAAAVLIVLTLLTPLLAELPYARPQSTGAELAVSFRHPGQITENCRDISEEEKLTLPPHMRRDRICDRGRNPVVLQISVDGELVYDQAHEPRGLWGDGSSVAVLHLPIEAGSRRVHAVLIDGPEGDPHETTATLDFDEQNRRVLLFDRSRGFTWHGAAQ